MRLQVHRILDSTLMAGPGRRFCVWVQGCSRHCEGCAASDTWAFDGGMPMDTDALFSQIAATPHIEGVTFLGGEPFEQAEAVAALAEAAQNGGLSVVTFTGYTLPALREGAIKAADALLCATDLLIDGPFERARFDLSRPWVGSANQRYHFLTGRYGPDDLVGVKNRVEVRIAPDGSALVNGMGDFDAIKNLL